MTYPLGHLAIQYGEFVKLMTRWFVGVGPAVKGCLGGRMGGVEWDLCGLLSPTLGVWTPEVLSGADCVESLYHRDHGL